MSFNEVEFGLETEDVCGFDDSQRTAIELQLCVSVAELGPWLYWNYKFPRFENFFGYAQIMSGTFIVQTVAIKHINQEVLHWRDISFGINQTTGCYARGLAQLINQGNLIANTVKTRQRFTSVRFKFLPGIKANCCLRWETAESKCDDVVADPNEGQGNPPPPKNHTYNPDERPEGQGGDGLDPTVNDGVPYQNDDDRPPYAEIFPVAGKWYEHVTFSAGSPSSGPVGDTDPASVWTAGGVCHEGVQGATDPQGKSGISALKNGIFQYCAQNPAKGQVTGLTFTFVPDPK